MGYKMLAVCLAILLAILPLCSLAEGATGSTSAVPDATNVFATFTQKGEKTPGITYTVQDLYFDGYLLQFSISQAPNGPGYTVYNDVLNDGEITEEMLAIRNSGSTPLGSYCELTAIGADGQEVGSTLVSNGSQVGNAAVRTYGFCFQPGAEQPQARVVVSYGVMETPGQVLGGIQTQSLTVPVQTPVVTRSVLVHRTDGEPLSLEEVFIAETEQVAGIYAFYPLNPKYPNNCPLRFADTADAELAVGGSDGERQPQTRGYLYHAIVKTGALDTIAIEDLRLNRIFQIDLANGTATEVQ